MKTATLLHDEDEAAIDTPHLSHSRLNRYLTCPESYRLYYVEGLRPKVPPASLVFGSAIHQSLARMFSDKANPADVFVDLWGELHGQPLQFSHRDTHDSLGVKGIKMLDTFVATELPRLGNVAASEKGFELTISNLNVPLVGVIDLLADLDGVRTVVDFKTASAAYEDHEAAMSDQLTAYLLAEPTAEQAALCVFVKTKEPRIEWLMTHRTGEDLVAFLHKAELIGSQIAAGQFYRRPGRHCSYCDFLPICLGNKKRAEETLARPTT